MDYGASGRYFALELAALSFCATMAYRPPVRGYEPPRFALLLHRAIQTS